MPSHERAVAAVLREPRPRRHLLARGVTGVPRVRAHRDHRRQRLPPARVPRLPPRARDRWRSEVGVMTSAGGLVELAAAADRPAALLLSGPAAGVRAAAAIAAANGFAGAISFDMGGTSTDVCLIQGGIPDPAPSLAVGGYPVRLPAHRHPHDRRRRRLARRHRPGRRAPGRPPLGRRGARAGVLRAGRAGAHGHRRRRRAWSHPGVGHLPWARSPRCRGGRRGPGPARA